MIVDFVNYNYLWCDLNLMMFDLLVIDVVVVLCVSLNGNLIVNYFEGLCVVVFVGVGIVLFGIEVVGDDIELGWFVLVLFDLVLLYEVLIYVVYVSCCYVFVKVCLFVDFLVVCFEG